MVLSWTDVKALLTIRSIEPRSSRPRTPERMPVMKRILNCCRWELPFRARSISSGGDKHAQRLGEQGDGGQEFDFHDKGGSASGILGDGEGGTKVRHNSCVYISMQVHPSWHIRQAPKNLETARSIIGMIFWAILNFQNDGDGKTL